MHTLVTYIHVLKVKTPFFLDGTYYNNYPCQHGFSYDKLGRKIWKHYNKTTKFCTTSLISYNNCEICGSRSSITEDSSLEI
jgi:hypothetical protein